MELFFNRCIYTLEISTILILLFPQLLPHKNVCVSLLFEPLKTQIEIYEECIIRCLLKQGIKGWRYR